MTDPSAPVRDNAAEHRLELDTGNGMAFLDYSRTATSFTIVHTEVPPEARGHHAGGALVEAAVANARAAHLMLIVKCPFARTYLAEHPR
jgi:hypothetical protein